MQAVTLNVLDLLPCLIWEPLVKSHSNETQVWKRCRDLGETMLRAAVHIFTVNELMLQMLWRRNRGCLRQEFPCCVFKPSEEEVLCVNNSTWRWDGLFIWCVLIRLDCCGVLSAHLGGKGVWHSANGHALVLPCELGGVFLYPLPLVSMVSSLPFTSEDLRAHYSCQCAVEWSMVAVFASLWPRWVGVYLSPFFSEPPCAQRLCSG